jgi:hypothetical protein
MVTGGRSVQQKPSDRSIGRRRLCELAKAAAFGAGGPSPTARPWLLCGPAVARAVRILPIA